MTKKTSTILILLSILFYSFAYSQSRETNSSISIFKQQVDSIVTDKMSHYGIPGLSVGIIRNGSIIYSKGYGVKNIKTKETVTENTIFHTASISKLFTALAIFDLTIKGKLSLDSKLNDLIPNLKYTDERVKHISVLNLLNHTSGLPDVQGYNWKNNSQSDKALEEYVLALDLKLKSDPSSKYYYSNLGYDILGYLVERISGNTFGQYIQENILASAGMVNSDFRYFLIPDSLKSSPHSKRRISGKVYVRKTYPYNIEHSPSSTLNSSAKDLSNWMISFIRALHSDSSNQFYTEMIVPSFDDYPNIGLGFQLFDFMSHKAIGHFGGDQGFRSLLIMIPEEKIGLVLLANCDYNEDFRQEILLSIAKLLLEL